MSNFMCDLTTKISIYPTTLPHLISWLWPGAVTFPLRSPFICVPQFFKALLCTCWVPDIMQVWQYKGNWGKAGFGSLSSVYSVAQKGAAKDRGLSEETSWRWCLTWAPEDKGVHQMKDWRRLQLLWLWVAALAWAERDTGLRNSVGCVRATRLMELGKGRFWPAVLKGAWTCYPFGWRAIWKGFN